MAVKSLKKMMSEQIVLTKESFDKFRETCSSPAPRNEALERAMRRHKDKKASGQIREV